MSIAKDFIEVREAELIKYIELQWGEMIPAEKQMALLGFAHGLACANDYHVMIQKPLEVKS